MEVVGDEPQEWGAPAVLKGLEQARVARTEHVAQPAVDELPQPTGSLSRSQPLKLHEQAVGKIACTDASRLQGTQVRDGLLHPGDGDLQFLGKSDRVRGQITTLVQALDKVLHMTQHGAVAEGARLQQRARASCSSAPPTGWQRGLQRLGAASSSAGFFSSSSRTRSSRFSCDSSRRADRATSCGSTLTCVVTRKS